MVFCLKISPCAESFSFCFSMMKLVEEVADTAYEKACEVVSDTVRAETQKEDIRAASQPPALPSHFPLLLQIHSYRPFPK